MVRFDGQRLPDNPKIALIANDAIGNWVMATPILQLLRSELQPSELHMYCGTRASELQNASDVADRFFNLHGGATSEFLELMSTNRGNYDLVVNLESTALSKTATWILGSEGFVSGPCLGEEGRGELSFGEGPRGDLWRDKQWVAPDLVEKYSFLRSAFISEIFSRLFFLEGELPLYRLPSSAPSIEVPDVLIATSASLPEKLWPTEKWVSVLESISRNGFTIGLLGAKPSDQSRFWLGSETESVLVSEGLAVDLRGKLLLPEVVGALAKARAVLTIDNGILHLSVAAGAPTIGLYRNGIHRLWAPPYSNLRVVIPKDGEPVSSMESRDVEQEVVNVLK